MPLVRTLTLLLLCWAGCTTSATQTLASDATFPECEACVVPIQLQQCGPEQPENNIPYWTCAEQSLETAVFNQCASPCAAAVAAGAI